MHIFFCGDIDYCSRNITIYLPLYDRSENPLRLRKIYVIVSSLR